MKATLAAPRAANNSLREWKSLLNQFADEVETWAQEENWSIHKSSKKLTERGLGSYRVPVLKLKSPDGEIWIEPTARFIAGGGEGRIDIVGWPTHSRATLIRNGNTWKIFDDYFKPVRKQWSKKALTTLIEQLAA